MHFEHIIEINAAGIPLAPLFTRAELWRGLLIRVFEPEAFPVGPDSSDWREDAGTGAVLRTVRFGPLEINDAVRLEPMRRIVFDTEPRPDMAPIRLTITLEEPAAEVLVLRFVYENDVDVSAAEAPYEACRHQAWLENDRDMVRTLRAWQQQGRLASA